MSQENVEVVRRFCERDQTSLDSRLYEVLAERAPRRSATYQR
jgi:hypothetical protein